MSILNNESNEHIDIDRIIKMCEDKVGDLDFYKFDLVKMMLGRFFDEFEVNEDGGENKLLGKGGDENTEAYVVVKNTLRKYKILK